MLRRFSPVFLRLPRFLMAGALLAGLSPCLGQEPQPPTEPAPVEEKTENTPAPELNPKQKALQALAEPSQPAIREDDDKHVISQSRVFSVSGGDALRMGAIASRADDIRHQLCRLLGMPETRGMNISIRLIGKTTDERVYPSMRRGVNIIGDESSLILSIAAGGGVDLIELNKNIVAMCLYEYALREIDVDAFEGSINIPEWLIVGIQQAVLWRNGKIEREIYQQLFDRAEMLSPEQLINCEDPSKLDAISRQVFEASCAVIILGLLNQEDGPESLLEMLRDSALSEGNAEEMIGRYFHALGVSTSALAKWWALELASLAVNKTSEIMTPMETEAALSEALCITYYDPISRVPERVSFDDVYRIVQLQNWQKQLRPIPAALTRLSVRCYPSYRPFIVEYVRAMEALLKSQDPDAVQGIIGPLRELREAYIITSTRVRDYLDWYEITHTGKERSSSFNAYLDAMQMLRHDMSEKPTPISDYLRDIEELYQLPVGSDLPKTLRPTP